MKWDRKGSKDTDAIAHQAILTPCLSVLWTPRHTPNSLLASVPSLYCTQINDSTNCSELGNKCFFFFLDTLLWCEQRRGSSHSQTCPRAQQFQIQQEHSVGGSTEEWATKQTKNSTTTALKHPASRDLNSVAVERSLQHQAIIVKWHQRRDVMASLQYAAHQAGRSILNSTRSYMHETFSLSFPLLPTLSLIMSNSIKPFEIQ